jgi:predicted lactoylglutathione lyase
MGKVRMVNVCPVFITYDVKRTVEYYVGKLGFDYAKHYDKMENFSAIYRNSVKIIIVEANKGTIRSNTDRYGMGYDAYIDPNTVEGVDELYNEFADNGVYILSKPTITEYGSYEFVFEDIDGRLIGVGQIIDKNTFFKNSNLRLNSEKI